MNDTEVLSVWFPDESCFTVGGDFGSPEDGRRVITRIVLRRDGNGPTSLYDRIHVICEDDTVVIAPAHHAQVMTLKTR